MSATQIPVDNVFVRLPRTHAEDWLARCGGEDDLIVELTAKTITLSLSPAGLNDLVSDAEYYATEMGPDNTGDFDYRPRARTCLRALKRHGLLNTSRVWKTLTPKNQSILTKEW